MTNAHDNSPRLYVPAAFRVGAEVALDADQSHYLCHVMRLETGAVLRVFNETSGEWQATIAAVSKKSVRITLARQLAAPETQAELWLYCAPIKRAHFDFTVMKATELGVSHIQPMLTARTQIREINPERCRAIAIEAAEQSARLSVPEICAAASLQTLAAHWPPHLRPLVCAEFGAAMPVFEALSSLSAASPLKPAIIVGPEGGFTGEEMALLRSMPHAMALRLGPRILRADTAALSALSCWQALCGDWRGGGKEV